MEPVDLTVKSLIDSISLLKPDKRGLSYVEIKRSAVAFAAAFLAADGALAFEGRYVAGDKAYRQELEIKKRAMAASTLRQSSGRKVAAAMSMRAVRRPATC